MANISTRTSSGPKSNGFDQDLEQLFNMRLQQATADLDIDNNAGLVLYAVGQRVKSMILGGFSLLRWPESLSTIEQCQVYMATHEEFAQEFAQAHAAGAYGRFLLEAIAPLTDPAPLTGPAPTLLFNFLFPSSNSATIFTPPVFDQTPGGTMSTALFDPKIPELRRLPFLVKQAPNLGQEMKAHLLELLGSEQFREAVREPAPANFVARYDGLKEWCLDWKEGRPLKKEVSVRTLADNILGPVKHAYHALTKQELEVDPEPVTTDTSVRTDQVIGRSLKELFVIWEDKNPSVGEGFFTAILDRFKNGPPFEYGRRRPTQGYGKEEAILATLAWHATDHPDITKRPSWALLFSGEKFMPIFMIHTQDTEGKARLALYPSRPMPTFSPNFSIISATLYMALASAIQIEPSEFLRRFGLEQPARPDPVRHFGNARATPPYPSTPSKNSLRRSTGKQNQNVNGFVMYMDGAAPVYMSRVTKIRKIMNKDISPAKMQQAHNSSDWPLLQLSSPPAPIHGAIGSVYRTSSGVVLKFAHRERDQQKALAQEAIVYERLQSLSVASVPKYLGLFASHADYVLALSEEGSPVRSFCDLNEKQRCKVYRTLEAIHKAGVLHGDFAPRNVVVKSSHPVIVDFSHAMMGHTCPGPMTCEELITAARELWGGDPYESS